LPFAYITCCMRVSFESGLEMTSLCAGCPPNRRRQQPTPAIVAVVVSLMQKPCAVDVLASVPDPGCCCFGGIAYWLTPTILLLRPSDGLAVSRDDVLPSVQTTTC